MGHASGLRGYAARAQVQARHADIADALRRDGERVRVQQGKVRALAGRERAAVPFVKTQPGGMRVRMSRAS